MFSYLLFSTSLLLAFIYSVDSVCICNVRYNGEYCGTQLNRLNGNNNCTRDQYFCGDNNRNKSAVIIKRCSPGNECDVIKNGGNACLADIDCSCGPNQLVGQKYCGSVLIGRDCSNDVLFTCGLDYPEPYDGCLYGCRNSRCNASGTKRKQKS